MMRSARLRFPSNINLLVKRATFRLLYFASGTSSRRTTLTAEGRAYGICYSLASHNRLFAMTCDGPTCLNNSGGIGFGAMYSTLFFLTLRVGRNLLRPYFLPPLVAAACPGLGRLAPY